MILRLLVAALFTATVLVFSWPWVSPHLLRRDATARLLDRLEQEWRRELDSSQPEDQWNW